ncbi:MAG TPA: superoxide dismutase family protein [Xanthobacteraceae bacterium]|jgi:Cu-Zn family superoxide dismutase|nr:superoxide dismutase family protein [Xanthobacteraceae bacterium]
MYHFTAIAASVLLLVATSAVANEMPSRQLSEKSTIEKSSPPSSDLAPVRIAQRAKDGAAASKKSAPATPPATAEVKTADGKDVGIVTLTQTRSGVRLSGSLKGLPAGEHALHVHSVGKCEPPFTSAGPHFNPAQKKHGKLNPEGHHAGDMDNIVVPASGNLALKMVNKDITLEKGKPNSVFQEGGTAVVIHAAKDDYTTDPTGNAGDRIACGVVK